MRISALNYTTLPRNRRLSKARHRSASLDKAAEYVSESGAASDSGSEESCEQVEMEITDEMMKFFATSQKHKLERGWLLKSKTS